MAEKKQLVTDPVCGMQIEPKIAHNKIEYEGHVVYFCSKHCAEEFKKNPKKYLSKLKKYNP
jgi:YHS domain-containing protein